MGSALSIKRNTSTGFQCEVFSETGLPVFGVLGNSYAAGRILVR